MVEDCRAFYSVTTKKNISMFNNNIKLNFKEFQFNIN